MFLIVKFLRDLLSGIFIDLVKDGTLPLVLIDTVILILITVVIILLINKYIKEYKMTFSVFILSFLGITTYLFNYEALLYFGLTWFEIYRKFNINLFNYVLFCLESSVFEADPFFLFICSTYFKLYCRCNFNFEKKEVKIAKIGLKIGFLVSNYGFLGLFRAFLSLFCLKRSYFSVFNKVLKFRV